MAKTILNFHFDYLTPSLIENRYHLYMYRMAGSPDKKEFLKGRMNIVDSLVMRIAELNTHDVLNELNTHGHNIHCR